MNKHEFIFECYLNKKNIFITGPGGTGKTYSIQKIYKHAIDNNKKICVTALTGVASLLLDCNATTIHSWAGIGLSNKSNDNIIKKIISSNFYKHNWINTEILVIDEISMLSEKIFDLLDVIGKKIRNNNKPFGGIQLIFSGDFFQLPPVNEIFFCFESDNFLLTFDEIIILDKIYRQTDKKFSNILLNLRKGLISNKTIKLLNEKIIDNNFKELNNESNIVRLVPTKAMANEINDKFMNKIKSKVYIYKRTYNENSDNLTDIQKFKLRLMSEIEKENEYNFIKQSNLTNEKLSLKKGCFVMCITNLDLKSGIANGSIGEVIEFSEKKYPIVKFEKKTIEVCKKEWKSDNIPGMSINQVPLILAWGITIHKAQGLTLSKAILDIGNNIFEAGQMYVALSRLKDLDNLYLQNFCIDNLKINKKVLEFYSQFK
jgi:ATP-dependent DNA helicase PIF1